jgi:hypothetical protein
LVDIDCGIVKLIQLLWSLGIGTCVSCKDNEGEVNVGVPGVELAVRCRAFAHFDESPPREQLVAWRRKLEKLQRAVRKCSPGTGKKSRRCDEKSKTNLSRGIRNLRTSQREMLEYEQKGTARKSRRGAYGPPEELRVSPGWRWTIHRPNFDLLQISMRTSAACGS